MKSNYDYMDYQAGDNGTLNEGNAAEGVGDRRHNIEEERGLFWLCKE